MTTEFLKEAGEMSEEQLREANNYICERIRNLVRYKQRAAAGQFMEGDIVEFFSNKKYRNIRGPITKICQKNIQMLETSSGMKWVVTATLLKKVV
jgi:hypothetical protein